MGLIGCLPGGGSSGGPLAGGAQRGVKVDAWVEQRMAAHAIDGAAVAVVGATDPDGRTRT